MIGRAAAGVLVAVLAGVALYARQHDRAALEVRLCLIDHQHRDLGRDVMVWGMRVDALERRMASLEHATEVRREGDG